MTVSVQSFLVDGGVVSCRIFSEHVRKSKAGRGASPETETLRKRVIGPAE